MSLLNTRTERESSYTPTITAKDALTQKEQLYGFGETYSAKFGLIKDEAWSVSSFFNNEGFYERADQVENIINTGDKDYSQYQKNGRFDYNKFALETGLVKTDEKLFNEKVAKLAKLREQRQEIIDRGSYWGDIAGSFAGYASDPLIIGTLPFGMVSGTVKGASILSNMARGFATQATVGLATEVPIQLSVYDYKKQIQSPYSKEEAYTAIASATLFSGLFGGGANGISGYLARRKELAQQAAIQFKTFKPIFNDEFTPTVRGIETYRQQQLAAKLPEGKPITAYHRTTASPFFDFKKSDKSKHSYAGSEGIYFSRQSDDPSTIAFGANEVEASVYINNPVPLQTVTSSFDKKKITFARVDIDELPSNLDDIRTIKNGDLELVDDLSKAELQKLIKSKNLFRMIDPEKLFPDDVAAIKKAGFDGIEVPKGKDKPAQIVALDASQVKVKKFKESGTVIDAPQPEVKKLSKAEVDKDIQEKLVEFSNQPAKKEHTAIFTVEHIVNQLRLRKGFRAEEVVLESYQTALNAGIKSVDGIKQAVIKTIDDKINELGTANPKNVKQLQEMKGRISNSTDVRAEMDLILKDNVMRDLDLLRIIDEADSPAPKSTVPVKEKVDIVHPKAKAGDLEDQYYNDTGTRESYNRDVDMYNTLETKEVVVLDADGNPKIVNADEVIKDLDDQLGELDSIMRCSRG